MNFEYEQQLIDIEFFGGPFDGYQQSFDATTGNLAKRVALPINKNVLLMLDGKDRGRKLPALKIAVYDLQNNKYVFNKSALAADHNIIGWLV